MGNYNVPYLCGGTLFFLLVQAKRARSKARERDQGKVDGLSDPAMMSELLYAITGSNSYAYKDSLKKDTSKFRECYIDGSIYIPFNAPATVSSYDYEIKHNYSSALLRMNKFADDFLSPAKSAWLVRVLLDVISEDAGICDNARFYVQRNGDFLLKSDMLSMIHYEFQPFLVGIIHYILINRRDNLPGQRTLDAWGTKPGKHSERKLKENFSLGNYRTVSVDWYIPDTSIREVNKMESTFEQYEPDENVKHIEIESKDVDDDSGVAGEPIKENQQSETIIQQQTNVMQLGEKSISLVNNGIINIDL